MTHERINADPMVMFGKPVIRGTRIPVETIVRWLGKGTSAEELMTEYDLTRADILAAQAYATDGQGRTQ